ncbi:MAG: flagellin [Phycisphaerales bacterium]|nr:MAG: flagellin [Phycisphaerales bacterium]
MTRINTNVPAIIAMGRFRSNTNDLYVRLERLATGLRINRGKDDPAGLIASESLRKEIRGLSQAIKNSERAVNVISTAEGSLNEVSTLLLDLKALILGIANEGAISDEEVQANQLEIDSIISSIDRIANTTTFSGKKLLNGSLAYQASGLDTAALAHTSIYAARLPSNSAKQVLVAVQASAQTAQLVFNGATTSAVTIEISGRYGSDILAFQSGTTLADITVGINSLTDSIGVSAAWAGAQLTLNSTDFGSDAFVSVKTLSGNFIEAAYAAGTTVRDEGVDPEVLVNGERANTNGLRVDTRSEPLDARFYLTPAFAQALSQTTFDITGGGSLFQITPQINLQGQLNIGIESVSTANLGNTVVGFLSSLRSGGINEVARGNFTDAENILTEAIAQVASMRGRLGAVQKDKIETNINSQQIAFENVTASESAIRDADIATEVSALTRAQILIQATAMTLQISQQVPQTALSLLGA